MKSNNTGNDKNNQLITVGKIINTHGHRGEVKVIPLTDDVERFTELKKVVFCLNEQHRELTISGVRFHKNIVLLSFEEVMDMNEAINLKNGFLKINSVDLKELPAGRFYIFQIIGLNVYTDSGQELGKVINVIETGANDVYEVKNDVTGKHYLIPALKQVVKNIDIENNEMIITPIEGLLE